MATSKSKSDLSRQLQDFIRAGLEKETQRIIKSYKDDIIRDLDEVFSDTVAKMSIRVAKYYSVTDMGDEIRITVQKNFSQDLPKGRKGVDTE